MRRRWRHCVGRRRTGAGVKVDLRHVSQRRRALHDSRERDMLELSLG
jgi:hypothetical protein